MPSDYSTNEGDRPWQMIDSSSAYTSTSPEAGPGMSQGIVNYTYSTGKYESPNISMESSMSGSMGGSMGTMSGTMGGSMGPMAGSMGGSMGPMDPTGGSMSAPVASAPVASAPLAGPGTMFGSSSSGSSDGIEGYSPDMGAPI